MKPLAVDVIANAIRADRLNIRGAGELAERCVQALRDAGYVIIKDRTDPEGGIPGRS